jgi:hypothetical protein
MSLYATGRRFGQVLRRTPAQLRGLRAFFATAGRQLTTHGRRLVEPGVQRVQQQLPAMFFQPIPVPGLGKRQSAVRLGVESMLDAQRARDVQEMSFIANLPQKKVPDPMRLYEWSGKWTEPHRRVRVAREIKALRKEARRTGEGLKSVRVALQRAGMEFRKRAY